MLLLSKFLNCEFLKFSFYHLYWNKAILYLWLYLVLIILILELFPQWSVNGQYASQGKLGVAVLGNHVKKEVINI
jgi:hypothetical protein